MSGMQPDQNQQGQPTAGQGAGQQFFPPYQAPAGEPQPYMGAPVPSLPNPQQQAPPYQVPPVVSHTASSKASKLPLILIVFFVLLSLGASGFAGWAYTQMLDYKNNSDKKSAAAAEVAVKAESDRKDSEFIDKEKQPYKTYTSPTASGSVKINYPKTWSGYVAEDVQANPVDGYWHPDIVPGLQSKTSYALRLQVSSRVYVEEVRMLDSLVKAGTVKVSPYVPKNVTGVTGVRVEGELEQGKKGVMIILPLRDKTIKLITESQDFVSDFDNIVLANLTFVP